MATSLPFEVLFGSDRMLVLHQVIDPDHRSGKARRSADAEGPIGAEPVLNGTNLRSRPLVERRKLLSKLLKQAPENIKFSGELQGTKEELLQVARQFHLGSLVAKRRGSPYEAGRRSGAWVKVKLTKSRSS